MEIKKVRIGKKEVDPLGIPSGVVTTSPKCLESIANNSGGPGFFVTKSYSIYPRVVPEREEVEHPLAGVEYGYRESIFRQYQSRCFENAVGLTNPGCEAGAEDLSEIHVPENKAIIGSVFGKNIVEFVEAAGKIGTAVDAVEANVSCPHVKGRGMALCEDLDMIYDLPRAIKKSIGDKPVYVKLPPLPNIARIAKVAIDGGADGLVLINTERGYSSFLSNGNCGISGRGIKPLGLRCTRDVRHAVGEKVLMIAGGGIEDACDAREYFECGANAITVGSNLVGMNENEILKYFSGLKLDLEGGFNVHARSQLREVDMKHREVRIEKIVNEDSDFKIFVTDSKIDAKPGQFVFAMLPGNVMPDGRPCEKPFSVMDDDPFTLGILERGYFTKRFNSLGVGDTFYFRGPHGRGVDVPKNSRVALVGGGCGIAGLYLLAKKFSQKARITSFLGAKDKQHLPYLKEFRKYGAVGDCAEDGSLGYHGLVSDLLEDVKPHADYFFNCGPRAMIEAVYPIEMEITGNDTSRIFSSVDEVTRCGVGICGSCSDKKGRRSCVEGPFMNH